MAEPPEDELSLLLVPGAVQQDGLEVLCTTVTQPVLPPRWPSCPRGVCRTPAPYPRRLLGLGRLDGTAIVELTLGQVLCAVGQRDEGRAVLTRSRDAFARLGQDEMARQAQAAIDACAW